jgi:hypothetical protein
VLGATTLACVLAPLTVHAQAWVYVEEGHPLTYVEGYVEPDAAWAQTSFVEPAWWTHSAAGFGIGYADDDDNTVLTDMAGGYLAVYVRTRFTVGPERSRVRHLTLEARYDDGFVAHLNGTEVGRASLPAGPVTSTTPASSHDVTEGRAVFTLDPSLLLPGENVLAVQVHNASLSSSDLSFIPALWGSETPPLPDGHITRGPFMQQVGRTSALVVWETDTDLPSRLAYGQDTPDEHHVAMDTPTRHHVARLQDLRPGTSYAYQVTSTRVPSGVARFSTEGNLADPVCLGVFGDTRSNHQDHAAVVAGLVAASPWAAFHVGDLVANGAVPSQWDTFFRVERPLVRSVPLYPVLGNHEGDGVAYLAIFELPDDSGSPERYYTVRVGPVLVLALDQYGHGVGAGSEQHAFVRDVLAASWGDPSIRHRWVVMHHGPYDSGAHGSNLAVRESLVPLFELNGVDIVFSGHNHDYERGTVNGIKYVVTGGGGAPRYAVTGDWWTEVAESVLQYCYAEVWGGRATVTCKRTDGSVLDTFTTGGTVHECDAPADCASRPPGNCSLGESGDWACAGAACLWNCVVPGPDAGALLDGGTADAHTDLPDGSSARDGGLSGDGGALASGGSTRPPADGCACGETAGPGGAGGLVLLLLLVGWRRWRKV